MVFGLLTARGKIAVKEDYTIHADALAPKVNRASASMILAVQDKQHTLLFQTWVKPIPRYDSKRYYIFCNL